MTVKDLAERLAAFPDDTVIMVFNGDQGESVPVTGLFYTPSRNPLRRLIGDYDSPTLEFCTRERTRALAQ